MSLASIKNEWRHVKNFKILFEQKSIWIGQSQIRKFGRAPLTGARVEVFTEKMQKQSKKIIRLTTA